MTPRNRCSSPAAHVSRGAAMRSCFQFRGPTTRSTQRERSSPPCWLAPIPLSQWPRCASSPAPAGDSSASARRGRERACSTTTPTIRPRSRRRSPPCARSLHAGWWRCFSRISIRARLLWRGNSASALGGADVAVVLDVYPAREQAADFPGVDGRLVAGGGGRAVGRPPGRVVAALRRRPRLLGRHAAGRRSVPPDGGRQHRRSGQSAGRRRVGLNLRGRGSGAWRPGWGRGRRGWGRGRPRWRPWRPGWDLPCERCRVFRPVSSATIRSRA